LQSLADFATEFSPLPNEDNNSPWTPHIDGSSNIKLCGTGVVLERHGNLVIEQALKFDFKESNNQVEYEAIIVGLNLAINLDVKKLVCKSDSQLVVG